MDTKQLLLELSARTGVAGREDDVAAYASMLLQHFGPVTTTALGSVLCTVRPAKPGKPHLLLDAHMDEIGLMVTFIEKDGFLRVGACGGIDRRLLAAAPVTVCTAAGPISGVVCSVPPHLSSSEKKNQKVEDIYVDIGGQNDNVRPGDVVTLQSNPRSLLGDLVSGKSLDDRAGCVAHIKALEYLGDLPLSCGLSVVFSTMEEVGGMGAKTAAYEVNPTHAIAVDVSFAHTPDARKETCGQLKKGPMIGYAPILSRQMSDELAEVAGRENIPCQYEVMGGKTGTNADQIATAHGGVITGLLSIPQKYMHTPLETVAVCDVENTGRLIAAYIKSKWGGKL